MNDQEFLNAFEQGTLPHHAFPHRGHIRMAWLYLREHDLETAISRIRDGILQFAAVHRALQKYHETITLFWAYMVFELIQNDNCAEFESFALYHPDLLDKELIYQYYSKELLQSADARAQWTEPDLKPLTLAER